MVRNNEYGKIGNMSEIQEIKNKINSYIVSRDFPGATEEKEKIVDQMKDEYMDSLKHILTQCEIENENILIYAKMNFKNISREIQIILNERNEKHLYSKTEIIQKEYNKNIEEPENIDENAKSAISTLQKTETQIDYEDRIPQIVMDEIKDLNYSIERTLYNMQRTDYEIEKISQHLNEEKSDLTKHSLKIVEMLQEFDKYMTNKMIEINEEYISKTKEKNKTEKEKNSTEQDFKDEFKVDNAGNKIERQAIEQIQTINETQEKTKEKYSGSPELSPDDIF